MGAQPLSLRLPLSAPLRFSGFRGTVHGLHQQIPQPQAAVEIGRDQFKPQFIDPRSAQQDLAADVAESH